jgi:hypothetical protein
VSPAGTSARAELREMGSTTATGFLLFGAFLAFLLVRALIRLTRHRADRARGVIHARVERFLEG